MNLNLDTANGAVCVFLIVLMIGCLYIWQRERRAHKRHEEWRRRSSLANEGSGVPHAQKAVRPHYLGGHQPRSGQRKPLPPPARR